MSEVEVPKTLSGLGGWLDDRFHAAGYMHKLMRKVFPDHWSFLLGEIALWSFVILLLTGTFLTGRNQGPADPAAPRAPPAYPRIIEVSEPNAMVCSLTAQLTGS